MKSRYGQMMLPALIALGITSFTTPAQATLMVNIGGTIGGGTVVGGTTYTDNGPEDSNPAVGVIDIGAYLDSIAVNFNINGFSAASFSPVASLSRSANVNVDDLLLFPFSVDLFVTDTDFNVPSTPLTLSQTVSLLSSVGGIGASATAVGYYGPGNTPFDLTGGQTGVATSSVSKGVATNTPSFSGLISGPIPYSLTSLVHVDLLTRGSDPIQNIQLSSNLAATPIPEPSNAMLLGMGILGVASMMFRKKKSSTVRAS